MSETDPHAANTSLLAAQLSLLEGRQADVADLLEVGEVRRGPRGRAFVVHAALAVPRRSGPVEEAEWEDQEASSRSRARWVDSRLRRSWALRWSRRTYSRVVPISSATSCRVLGLPPSRP